MVIKNEQRAKKVSEELRQQIQDGKIRGIKSFDGLFYVIEDSLYQKYRQQLLQIINVNKKILLGERARKLGVSEMLCKIICEFLKDEGEIIEKRKESYHCV